MKKISINIACAVSTLFIGSAIAQVKNLNVQSVFPNNMIYQGESTINFAENVELISDGKLKIRIHSANDVVPMLEVFDAVSSGAIEAGWDWAAYWGTKIPVANLIGAMPFGPQGEKFVSWMYNGGGLEILKKAYEPHNVVPIPCHLTASEPGGWFNKEINEPSDFQGIRMRIGGLGAKVIEELGGIPQLIPGGEVYVSLERGRIDAAEFSHPSLDRQLGLHKVAKYYYFPGWHQPGSWNSLIINKKVWDELGQANQELLTTACRSNVLWSLYAITAQQAEILEEMRADGVEVRRFPKKVIEALRSATDKVLDEEANKDPFFKEALHSMNDHLAKVDAWYELVDTSN